MNTFYFLLVLLPVYVCDYMQMYFVRNDEKINMFNQYTCIEETWLRQQVLRPISQVSGHVLKNWDLGLTLRWL